MFIGLLSTFSASAFLEGAAAAIALYVAVKPSVKVPRTRKTKSGGKS